MKKEVTILIATRNRFYKLNKTIDSIKLSDKIHLSICFDGDHENFIKFCEYYYKVSQKIKDTLFLTFPVKLDESYTSCFCSYTKDNKGSVYCRNYMLYSLFYGQYENRFALVDNLSDCILYATDDIEFYPNAIEDAVETLYKNFPDGDGVVGFRQEDEHHPSGVALVGRKFYERYPSGLLFNPEYYHFAAQEVHWLAAKYDKFIHMEEVGLKHFHPGYYEEEMDSTHLDARKFYDRDHKLMAIRQNAGLIWGDYGNSITV